MGIVRASDDSCNNAPEPGQHASGLGPADRGPGQRGAEGDGGDHERSRGRGPPPLEQPPEVSGQDGVGGSLGAAPRIELPQRASVGVAGVRAQGVVGQVARRRGGCSDSRGDGSREGLWRASVVHIFDHNCYYGS